MKLHFYIKYSTQFGQSLYLTGDHKSLGQNEEDAALSLTYFNENYWHLTVEVKDLKAPVHYRYFLQQADGTRISDGDDKRSISPTIYGTDVVVVDSWVNRGFAGNIFYSEAFRNVLLPQTKTDTLSDKEAFSHEFHIKAPLLKEGETVCFIGSTPGLGSWQKDKATAFKKIGDYYTGRVLLTETDWPASYKYGVMDVKTGTFLRFEAGENRLLFPEPRNNTKYIFHDGFINEPVNTWKGAGIAIPVFSLRSKKSFGTGEFADIKLLVDWAKKTNMRLIQLLPVNDTIANFNWGDSYPYAAISAFAMHPLYVNLEKVAGKSAQALLKSLRKQQKELNAAATVNYPKVIELKMTALHEIFKVQKKELAGNEDFQRFIDDNGHWLLSYAAFCTLRDHYKTADFTKWRQNSQYDETAVAKMAAKGNKNYDSMQFYFFVQYHLHLQLKEAVEYAHKNKIAIKGDIPIGIYRYSCNAWVRPDLYNMNEQAGAPPDDFAKTGQNWGFPTYNWKKMSTEGFNWWKQRFGQMSSYFDGFRIDHILGFFRIWSIPIAQTQGIMGRFVPAIPVDISEFHYLNIGFDYDRLCQPYITKQIISGLFGDKAGEAEKYLLLKANGRYQIKEQVNTQSRVLQVSAIKADDVLKNGFLQLISNVILFEEEGSDRKKFHFRFDMESTSSFAHLDENSKRLLMQLYVDYFYRRQNNFWKYQGLKKLVPLKNSTDMLVFGEDLGMVPQCVPEVMKELAILSLEVERMPKSGALEFSNTQHAPYLSVVTPSTHDMSTIREWWQENKEKTQRFYNYVLQHYGEAPQECEPWICREIIQRHLNSSAMWSIFQIQDLLGIDDQLRAGNPRDERINDPANAQNHWNYRMPVSLESLLKENEFNRVLSEMILEGARV